jgi:hypothetical protein
MSLNMNNNGSNPNPYEGNNLAAKFGSDTVPGFSLQQFDTSMLDTADIKIRNGEKSATKGKGKYGDKDKGKENKLHYTEIAEFRNFSDAKELNLRKVPGGAIVCGSTSSVFDYHILYVAALKEKNRELCRMIILLVMSSAAWNGGTPALAHLFLTAIETQNWCKQMLTHDAFFSTDFGFHLRINVLSAASVWWSAIVDHVLPGQLETGEMKRTNQDVPDVVFDWGKIEIDTLAETTQPYVRIMNNRALALSPNPQSSSSSSSNVANGTVRASSYFFIPKVKNGMRVKGKGKGVQKGKGKKAKGKDDPEGLKAKSKGDPESNKTGDAPWKNLRGKRKSENGDDLEGSNDGRDKKNRRLSSNASASSPSKAQPLMGPSEGSL